LNCSEGALLGGAYRIERLLGRGGCGSVYLAQDLKLNRKVAIKLLGTGATAPLDAEAVQRFMREAQAIASVEHPGIVPIYGVGEENGASFIVMQYVAGQTLTERMREAGGRIALADALLVAQQVAAALEAAHQRGLVHRDIKPSNVMIDGHGYVKVMDFGLARSFGREQDITHTGMFVGTPSYSSPEQCETNVVDGRSDLYSLGVILYEMLAGELPHQADTPVRLMIEIVSEPPPPLGERNPGVPEAVQAIVARLLAKNPADRYQTAGELIVDLKAALDTVREREASGFQPTIRLPSGTRTRAILPARLHRRWPAVALAASLAVAVIGSAVYFHHRMGSAPPPPAGPVGMAIYDFTNATRLEQFDWLSLGLPDMLAANLGQHQFIQLRTRDDLLWQVQPRPARFDDALRGHLATAGVTVVAKGTVYRDGDNLRFVVHLLSLDEQRQLGIVVQKGTVADVFGAVDALSGQIARKIEEYAASSKNATGVATAGRSGSGSPTASAVMSSGLQFAQRLEAVAGWGGDGLRGREDQLPVRKYEKAIPPGSAVKRDGGNGGVAKPGTIGVPPAPCEALKLKAKLDDEEDSRELVDYPESGDEKGQAGATAGAIESRRSAGALAGADLATILPYYYQGRRALATTCGDRQEFAAREQELMRCLVAVANDPAALAKAYAKWCEQLERASQPQK